MDKNIVTFSNIPFSIFLHLTKLCLEKFRLFCGLTCILIEFNDASNENLRFYELNLPVQRPLLNFLTKSETQKKGATESAGNVFTSSSEII